jgi:peptidoglycan/LPS O-acetylase OafA/YrhL
MNINSYRRDITGLRACAVLAVLIFHIKDSLLLGGYLGVDIFFVISGYVISNSLFNSTANNPYHILLNFYKKRILRIAPTTIFIILLSIVLANIFMSVDDLITTSKASIFGVFGFANIYFYKYLDVSYFNPNANLQPLLHLWSLGVEEQFYLIFPLIFIVLKFKKNILLFSMIILCLLSLLLASYTIDTNEKFAYYMLPSRAFALLIGVIVAIYINNYKNLILSNKIASILSFTSALIIIIGLFSLSKHYLLPSYLSLIVVIPTAIIILIGNVKQTFIHNILASKYLEPIGLSSFSIYLIHWVILSFYKYINGIDLNTLEMIIIFIASIGFGWLSYLFIEQKFRFKNWNFFIIIFVFVAIPYCITQTNYYFARLGGLLYADIKPTWAIDKNTCHQKSDTLLSAKNNLFKQQCLQNTNKEPNVILWGDSNAYHYIPALNIIAKQIGFGFRNITHSACTSLNPFNNIQNDKICNYNSLHAYEFIKFYDVVILSSSWFNFIKDNNADILKESFDRQLKEISKSAKLILILGNSPIMDNLDLNHILKNSRINNNKNEVQGKNNTIVFEANNIIKDIVKNHQNVYYIDFNNIICNNKECQYKDGKNSIYVNSSHLSTYGSQYIGKAYINGNIDNVFYKIKELYKENDSKQFYDNFNKVMKEVR